jgi:hypothetical protein
MSPAAGAKGFCAVENALGMEASLELDAYLADPTGWPAATWPKGFKVPRVLPASMRQWGAVTIGLAWCADRGVQVSKKQMDRHVREHVPWVVMSPEQVAELGTDLSSNTRDLPAERTKSAVDLANPITYQRLYTRGLAIGDRSLELLAERIEEMVESGVPPSTDLLTKLADLGTKLAMSQASLILRGIGRQEREDEIEGFRSGSSPLPSERFGDHRVRVVEGVARPVVDRGPSDRVEYNKRAAQEGSPRLPSPT